MRRIVLTVAAVVALEGLAAAAFILSGLYNVAAVEPHHPVIYELLKTARLRSVAEYADAVTVPDLSDPALARRGLKHYRRHCLHCHGAPGVAPEPFALGMSPLPANLAQAARDRDAAELFWMVKYGISMTGMPAWAFRLTEAELWETVAFVQQLPLLSPVEYRALAAGPAGVTQ